jgi:hypothetical protein
MSFDVKEYDFKANRPFSKIYNEIIEACVSNTTKFLADMIIKVEQEFINDGNIMSDDHIEKVGAGMLFTLYTNWKTKTNHKDEQNTTSFGRELTNIEGITKERKSEGWMYFINIKELKKYFSKNNLFGHKKNDVVELSEIEKLQEIIKNQKLEIERYQKLLLTEYDKKKTYGVEIGNDINNDNITINIFKQSNVIKPKKEIPKEEPNVKSPKKELPKVKSPKTELSKIEKTKINKRKVHNDDNTKFNDNDVEKYIKDNNLEQTISLDLGEIFN